ncbi:MAG: MBL fold metallo-hydrolase [Pleomorphochaeta sp.]
MENLFHAVLGTGSCGNSYVIFDGKDSIIIDQGYSFVQFKRKFLSLGIPISSIKAIFMTHFHPDHCYGLKVTSNKLNVPLYIPKEAIEKEPVVFSKLNIKQNKIISFDVSSTINIGDFKITSFNTLHDSGGSVGYNLQNNGEVVTLITDTGDTTDEMVSFASISDILFLESNYDEDMLLNGPYSYKLKKRVRGKWGHLSNDQALELIKKSNFNGNYLYLIHLSDKNNDVELVDNIFKSNTNIPNVITCQRGSVVNVMEKVKVEE